MKRFSNLLIGLASVGLVLNSGVESTKSEIHSYTGEFLEGAVQLNNNTGRSLKSFKRSGEKQPPVISQTYVQTGKTEAGVNRMRFFTAIDMSKNVTTASYVREYKGQVKETPITTVYKTVIAGENTYAFDPVKGPVDPSEVELNDYYFATYIIDFGSAEALANDIKCFVKINGDEASSKSVQGSYEAVDAASQAEEPDAVCVEETADGRVIHAAHSMGDWVTITPADYGVSGLKQKTCEFCGYREEETIDALEHSYSTEKFSTDENHHWHECLDEGFEGYENGSDKGDHDSTGVLAAVAPTENATGLTAGKCCSVCGYVMEEQQEIPVLSEDTYDVSYKVTSAGVQTKTWTLKDTSVLGELSFDTVTEGNKVVSIDGIYYTKESFEKKFDGVALSIANDITVITVTNENGATINGEIVSTTGTLKFEGYPLTVIAPTTGGQGEGPNAVTNEHGTIIVDNKLTVGIANGTNQTKWTTAGISVKNLTVSANGSLTVNNYWVAVYLNGGALTINGEAFLNGVNYATRGSGAISAPNKLMFKDGTEVAFIATTTTGKVFEVVAEGTQGYDHNTFHYEVKTAPTENAAGVLNKICGGGHVVDTVDIPALNTTDYSTDTVTGPIQGVVCDSIEYTLNDTTYGTLKFNVITSALEAYIKAGTSYYSMLKWNELYKNQEATYINKSGVKTLTITLNGDTTVKASDGTSDLDGTFDLTLYDQVIINGEGSLNIQYSAAQDGIKAKKLTIEDGAVVNLVGYTIDEKSGMNISQVLNVNGELNVSNFSTGQYTDGGYNAIINIGTTGSYTMSNVGNGLNNWTTASTTVNNEGVFTVKDSVGVHANRGSLTFNTKSNGTTNILNTTGTEANNIIMNSNSNWTFDGTVNIKNVKGYGIYINSGKTINIAGSINVDGISENAIYICASSTITVAASGALNIENVGTSSDVKDAIYSKGTVDTSKNAKYGEKEHRYSTTTVANTFNIYGRLYLNNISRDGVFAEESNCDFIALGNSQITINTSRYGINTDTNDTILHCFFRDSSVTTFNTEKAAVANFVYFLVRGNTTDSDVKNNAKVTINVKSDAGVYASWNNSNNYFCVNSSQEFKMTRASKGSNAVELRAEGQKTVHLKTNTYFENFNSIFYAKWSNGTFANCSYVTKTVKKVNCGDMATGALASQSGSPKDYSGFRS